MSLEISWRRLHAIADASHGWPDFVRWLKVEAEKERKAEEKEEQEAEELANIAEDLR